MTKNVLSFVVGAILAVSSVALAQKFVITPVQTDRDLQRRVWQLERAVQELQIKVYQLQSTPKPPVEPVANPKAFFCQIEAFGTSFSAYGPTQLEAREGAEAQCRRSYAELHCSDAACQKNE